MKHYLFLFFFLILLMLMPYMHASEEIQENQTNLEENTLEIDVGKEWELFQEALGAFLDKMKLPEDPIPYAPNTPKIEREMDEYFLDQWRSANRKAESSSQDAQEQFIIFREKLCDFFASVLAKNGFGNYKNHVRSYIADQLTLWYIDFMKKHLFLDNEEKEDSTSCLETMPKTKNPTN